MASPPPPEPRSPQRSQGAVAVGFVVLLLILATTQQGAFQISRWAPLGLFALAILIGALLTGGGLSVRSRAAIAGLGGIWGLAGWSLLSMLWAASAAGAFQAGDELVLYAVIATLPLVLPVSGRVLAQAGWAITAGIGAIAYYALVRLLVDGGPLYLAGRLNGPINYRNATALLFAMAVPACVVAAAARGYGRPLRAIALATATLCLGLAFLTQSRGILLGLAAGEIVILALGPDRVRRAWTSVVPLAAVAAGYSLLLRPFHAFDGGHGVVSAHDISVAARGLLLITLCTFLVGMVLAIFDNGVRPNSPGTQRLRSAARVVLVLGVVVAIIGAGVAIGNPVSYLRGKWDQFTSLQYSTPTTTRLLTTSGQRYDLWRVAVKEFRAHPVGGVGAGSYSFGYYRYRTTDRNLTDPHSLVFATLSETGAVGLALLIVFVAGGAVAVLRGWRRLDDGARRPLAASAATGVVLLGQSLVDWMWLIPGLTAIGIFSLGLAVAQAGWLPRPEAGDRARPRRRRLPRAAGIAATAGAIVALLALFLSDAYVQRARALVANPPAALSAARTAAKLDPWSVTPHYLEASALETGGNRPAAYAQLRDALRLEPSNSATLGVLGDFEARGHHLTLARAYYRRALALNPLDTGLQQLARLRVTPAASRRAARKRHR